MNRKKYRYLYITIKEPFPVFYGHVSQKSRRCGEAEGPHYVAGSEWPHLAPDQKSADFVVWKAEQLRKDGYTVTTREEWR